MRNCSDVTAPAVREGLRTCYSSTRGCRCMQLLGGLVAALIYYVCSTRPAVIGGWGEPMTSHITWGATTQSDWCCTNLWLSYTPSIISYAWELSATCMLRIHVQTCIGFQWQSALRVQSKPEFPSCPLESRIKTILGDPWTLKTK